MICFATVFAAVKLLRIAQTQTALNFRAVCVFAASIVFWQENVLEILLSIRFYRWKISDRSRPTGQLNLSRRL